MCSLTESELEPELIKCRLDPSQILLCKKCRQNKPNVNLRGNDAYCRECFLTAVHHKFRATLGKHKAMRPGDKVCVGYSGGGASASLLHLLKTGIESDHKKLLFHPHVLHVDEGCLFQLPPHQRLENIRTRVKEAGSHGFPVSVSLLEDPTQVVTLSQPLQEHADIHLNFSESMGGEMYTCVHNIKENSAREDFINTVRRRAIVDGAKLLGCSKAFTGENSTKISIDLLAGVSLGKGVNLAHETGFRDTRDAVMILRPLRDVSGKELAVYAQFHGLKFSPDPNFGTGKDSLFSIRKLTEDFLVGLQADFPATLSTVFRTGDKLQVDTDIELETCILCGGPLDTGVDEHCALQATQWSEIVSCRGTTLDDTVLASEQLGNLNLDSCQTDPAASCQTIADECCGEGDGSCQSSKKKKKLVVSDLLPLVCYACMRTVGSFKSLGALPDRIKDEIHQKRNRMQMKNEIQDFLL